MTSKIDQEKFNLLRTNLENGPIEEIRKKIEKENHSFGMIFDYLKRDYPKLLSTVSKKLLGKVLLSLGLKPNAECSKQPNSFKLQYRYTQEEMMNFALMGQKKTAKIRNLNGSYFKVQQERTVEERRRNSPRCIEFYTFRGLSLKDAEAKISVLATKGALASLKKTQKPRTEKMVEEILASNNILFSSQFVLKVKTPDTFGRKSYFYDFYLPKSNLIIEVNGTYWHCDKRFWQKDQQIKLPGKGNVLVEYVWEADRQKVENAEKMGYNVLVVWEHDLYQSTSNVEKEILNEIHRTN